MTLYRYRISRRRAKLFRSMLKGFDLRYRETVGILHVEYGVYCYPHEASQLEAWFTQLGGKFIG